MTLNAWVDNRDCAIQFLDRCFSNRAEQAIAMLAPDAIWEVMGPSAKIRLSGKHDRAKAERILRGIPKALPDGMTYTIVGTTAEGDRVAVEVDARGQWIDGRIYHNNYHFLMVVRKRRITQIREYIDTLSVYLMENPPIEGAM